MRSMTRATSRRRLLVIMAAMLRRCGEKIECENCAISKTYHKPVTGSDAIAQPGQRLECHYCGFRRGVPKTCSNCESEHLYCLGAGSQPGEERLQQLST